MITPAETGKEPLEESAVTMHPCGEEIDDSQEWIGEELARRMKRIESGEEKSISLDELSERLEKLRLERANHS
jgi:hypothetical protein